QPTRREENLERRGNICGECETRTRKRGKAFRGGDLSPLFARHSLPTCRCNLQSARLGLAFIRLHAPARTQRSNAALEIRRQLSLFSNLNARISFAMLTRFTPRGRKSGHISPSRQMQNDGSRVLLSYLFSGSPVAWYSYVRLGHSHQRQLACAATLC